MSRATLVLSFVIAFAVQIAPILSRIP